MRQMYPEYYHKSKLCPCYHLVSDTVVMQSLCLVVSHKLPVLGMGTLINSACSNDTCDFQTDGPLASIGTAIYMA